MGNSKQCIGSAAISAVVILLIAFSSTPSPAQMMDGRRDSMGPMHGERSMEGVGLGIGLGLAVGNALQQQQKDSKNPTAPTEGSKKPKAKNELSQQKKGPPPGKPAVPPPAQAQTPPQQQPAGSADSDTPPPTKQAGQPPDDPKLVAPCPDCADIAARVARLAKQIEADVAKADETARERDNFADELKGYERGLAETVQAQDKVYYAKMTALTKDSIRSRSDLLDQIKSRIQEQRELLARETIRLRECIAKACAKVSLGPPQDQPPPPKPPVTKTPPATPEGPTTTAPPEKPSVTTTEKPPEKPSETIDISKLIPPVGSGKPDGIAHDPPGGGIFVVDKSLTERIPDSICGPDITDQVFAALRSMKIMYDANPQKQEEACRSLIDPQIASNAWDIIDLAPRTAGTWFTPDVSAMCAIPRPQCTASVEFLGTCYHAQVVNYVQWGMMTALCGGAYPEVGQALHQIRNIGLTVKGIFTGGSAPTEAQLRMVDVGAEYAKMLESDQKPDVGPGSEIRRKHMTRSNLIGRQELACNLSCKLDENRSRLLKERTFRYRWVGLTPPEQGDERYDGRTGR